ncbi:MAG: hypothetical protein HY688_02720, partial [Chloroflexi bacterium]|nr:hypothetical protein [Chloroflexota bacterium]
MTRHTWWKPLATAGFVAGLLAATLVTATAASEGGLLRGESQRQVQAPPAQSDGSQSGQSQTDKSTETPRPWVWAGEVGQSETEGGHLELRGTCGAWALLPADEA